MDFNRVYKTQNNKKIKNKHWVFVTWVLVTGHASVDLCIFRLISLSLLLRSQRFI